MRIKLIASLVLILQLTLGAGAQRLPGPPKYPWHFVDIWWTSPAATTNFNELSIDFRIIGEIPDTVDLYIAPLGLSKIGSTPLYGGVQTSTGGWPNKQTRIMEKIGRGGIFSRWSANNTKIPIDRAEGPTGTHYEAADYEDNFISVRRKVNWRAGSYTYLVRRARSLPTDASYTWFTAYVRDNSNGTETEIGSLRIDGPNYSLDREIAAFVEVFGSTSPIPQVTVAFSEPRINGIVRSSTSVKAVYPPNETTDQPRFATSTKIGREIVVTLRPNGVADKVRQETFR
jgi:hypothetical protein